MSNITVEKDTSKPAQTSMARREGWDPFATMREMMRWEPFRDLAPAQWLEPGAYSPAFEVKETKDAFEFKADVPGVESKDIDVKLTDNRLTVSGKREAEKSEKGETYYSYERSYGSFSRSFTVPEGTNADAVRADLKDGVLKIVLPKKPEAKPRQITVKSG
jgi:HSP20 family protein